MKLHAFAQKEGVGLAVLGDLPAVRKIRNDRLAAVARIVPDQIVEHAGHRAESTDRPGLVDVEMRRTHHDAEAQDAAGFGIGLGSRELKFRAVEFVGDLGGVAESRRQPVCARDSGGAALQKAAAGPPRACKTRSLISLPSPRVFSGRSTAVL